MERKKKLAKLILMEAQAIKETDKVDDGLALAEELTKDAIELAKIVDKESEEK